MSSMPCRFIEVVAHHYPDYFGFARWYYRGKHFPLYQLVWPSTDGHYPWDTHASKPFKDCNRSWENLPEIDRSEESTRRLSDFLGRRFAGHRFAGRREPIALRSPCFAQS
jgi:hypothetical protein